MDLRTIFSYLAAAAISDGPLEGKERELLRLLIRDFGADFGQAQQWVEQAEELAREPVDLASAPSKEQAWKLLRALLVISYCDGSFDPEELPYLSAMVDRFGFSAQDLNRAKQQALYFLRPEFPAVEIPAVLIQSQNWNAVAQAAKQHLDFLRKEYFHRFQSDLSSADEEACYLAMDGGPPSFDTEHAKRRFLQNNPDFFHADEDEGIKILRDRAEFELRKKWEASYLPRCGSCHLEAPGRRRDPCPRCRKEYGEAV